jgi:hypothetical protein
MAPEVCQTQSKTRQGWAGDGKAWLGSILYTERKVKKAKFEPGGADKLHQGAAASDAVKQASKGRVGHHPVQSSSEAHRHDRKLHVHCQLPHGQHPCRCATAPAQG